MTARVEQHPATALAPCHVCGTPTIVRANGCFRNHSRYPNGRHAMTCEGAGQRADDARLAARGKVYREADSARRSETAARATLAHARRLIERTEADLPRLESRALEAAEALAAFDRELPAVTP